jgi:predicted transcriptional regulator of viral defense system
MAKNSLVHSTGGIELVRQLSAAGQRIFTAEHAAKIAPSVGISPGYLREALHHLARSGWIVRLHRGLYALAGSAPGVLPLHDFEVAMALVQPAAVSHWSALNYHGLTEQIPRRVFVLTSARSVPRPRGVSAAGAEGYTVGGTVYQFVRVNPERFFGVQDVWVDESRVKLTDPERTLLDGLMAPQYCGDFGEVLHAFEMRGAKLDVDRIIGYALKLDAATVKRLGWVLERQGIPTARLEPLRAAPIKGSRVLDPTGPRRGPSNAAWSLQVNLPGRAA